MTSNGDGAERKRRQQDNQCLATRRPKRPKASSTQYNFSPSPPRRKSERAKAIRYRRISSETSPPESPVSVISERSRRRRIPTKTPSGAAIARNKIPPAPDTTLHNAASSSSASQGKNLADTADSYLNLALAVGPWVETAHYYPVVIKDIPRDNLPYPALSVLYREPIIMLTKDRLSAMGSGGWSTVLGTHGSYTGQWYYEVTVCELQSKAQQEDIQPLTVVPKAGTDAEGDEYDTIMGNQSVYSHSECLKSTVKWRKQTHIRVGWSCRYTRYDLPVGHSPFSVAIFDRLGETIRSSQLKPYADRKIEVGDVVGCFISLGIPTRMPMDPRKSLSLHCFVESGLLCNPEKPPQAHINANSYVEFSINGERFGRATNNLYDGFYHPAISLFNGACVKVNFGPEFKYPSLLAEGVNPCFSMSRPKF